MKLGGNQKIKVKRALRHQHFCMQCGKSFSSHRPDAQFCSATCRQIRHRLEKVFTPK
jgi:predicted nucleic acid-binding Zn ribbon protein